MKICKDCKHYLRGAWDDFCNLKNVIDKSTVNRLSTTCKNQRSYGWLMARLDGTCGREGRFHELKDTPHDTP